MNVQFTRVHPDATVPQYHTPGAAAFDFALVEDVSVPPRGMVKVRTGLIIKTPDHHALIIAARSSSPLKKGITAANGIGVIDSDYAGPEDEIHLLLLNLTNELVALQKGDRVAQGIIMPVVRAVFEETHEALGETRGGFGSTGG